MSRLYDIGEWYRWSLNHIVVTLHDILFLVPGLLSVLVFSVHGFKSTLLDITSRQRCTAQLVAPAPHGDQRPPLRDHEHKRAPGNAHLHRLEPPQALGEPLIVPAKPSVDVAAYRGLVYPPARDHRVHVPEVEGEESVEQREGDEGERGGVDKGVS